MKYHMIDVQTENDFPIQLFKPQTQMNPKLFPLSLQLLCNSVSGNQMQDEREREHWHDSSCIAERSQETAERVLIGPRHICLRDLMVWR